MQNSTSHGRSNPVAIWLLIGVFMIIVQVLLGGITRLTGSGLSITEWKPILGALPPMNEADWNRAFEQYKQIGQYKHLNFEFTLSDFKFIYFWEWFHREWARFIGVVFIIPFIWFVVKRRIEKWMINPMIILFLLGLLQAMIGWIMVASGLNDEMLYVDHIRLAVHFISALGLLCYTLWFALRLLIPASEQVIHPVMRQRTQWVLVLLVLQLLFGAFMAGLKAVHFATTWPSINGEYIPSSLFTSNWSDLTHDPVAVHFIHRNLAYVLAVLIILWQVQVKKIDGGKLFNRFTSIPAVLVLVQVVLGILTVLYANNSTALLWLGVSHQFTGMMLLLSLLVVLYFFARRKT